MQDVDDDSMNDLRCADSLIRNRGGEHVGADIARKSGLSINKVRDVLDFENEAMTCLNIDELLSIILSLDISKSDFLSCLSNCGVSPAIPFIIGKLEYDNNLERIEDECGWRLSDFLETGCNKAYCMDALRDIAAYFGVSLRALTSEVMDMK